MRNGHHRLGDLNTLFPVGGTVWGGRGGKALLGVGFEMSRPLHDSTLSSLLLIEVKDVSSQLSVPVICFVLAYLLPPMINIDFSATMIPYICFIGYLSHGVL